MTYFLSSIFDISLQHLDTTLGNPECEISDSKRDQLPKTHDIDP